MTEKSEFGQKQTYRKYDIAQAINEVRSESEDENVRHSVGYILGQISIAADDLAGQFPAKYMWLKSKLEYNREEVEAILSQLVDTASVDNQRAKNFERHGYKINNEFAHQVLDRLFPPPEG